MKKIDNAKLRNFVKVLNSCFTKEDFRELREILNDAGDGPVEIERYFEDKEVDFYKKPDSKIDHDASDVFA